MNGRAGDVEGLSAEAPATVFRTGLAQGHLLYQRCDACGAPVFYPRVLCPRCGSPSLRWAASSGRGHVYATTTVRARSGVHNVSLVDLEEGFRMMCRIESHDDEPVGIGQEVDAVLRSGTTPEDLTFVVRGAGR